jgi:hypothetical protein
MSVYDGKYTEKSVTDKSFRQDRSSGAKGDK